MANEITITETVNEVTVDETTLEVTVESTTNEFSIVTTGAIVPTKAEIGLDQVDNTSDANKPISTATQTALNLKADKANPQLSGTMTLANDFTISGDLDTASNRPKFRSNTGDVTGVKVLPPSNNSTNESAFQFHSKNSSSDAEVLSVGAKNSATNPMRLGLGELVNGVMQDSTKPLSIVGQATDTVFATIPASSTPSVGSDLTRKDYIDTVIGGLVTESNPTMTGTASLSDGFTFGWSENSDRTARLNFKSSDGNTTGVRVLAPSTASSGNALATNSVFNSSDSNNGKFVSFQARDAVTDPLRVSMGAYASGVLGSSATSLAFYDNVTKFASLNPSGPTNSTDLTTKTYVDALVAGKDNTDEITEGTTNLYFTNERVDDRVNDLLIAGTGITKTYSDAGNNLTIAVDSGNIRVGTTGVNEITTTTGNLSIDSAGGTVTVNDNLTVTGNLVAQTNLSTYDNFVVVNYDVVGAPSENAGITVNRGSSADVLVRWNETTDRWGFTNNGTTYYNFVTSTTDLAEGTNQYYTQGRFDTAFSNKETDDLTEGTTNLYFTNARAQSAIANTTPTLAGVTAGNITIGVATDNTITTTSGDLTIDAAGGDTFVESNLVAKGQLNTYDNNIVVNYDVVGAPTDNGGLFVNRGSSADVGIRWNETTDKWGFTNDGTNYINFAVNTDGLSEGSTNQYFTQSRARQSISVTDSGGDGSLAYDNSTGVITYTGPSASEVRAHFSGGTGVTITNGSIAIGQSVGTGDSPAFAGVTGGNIAVGTTDDNTIISTNANGNITIDPNGTGVVIFDSITRLRGESQATTNNSYVFPVSQLTTISDNNGYSAASSFGTTGLGNQANAQYIHYTGDTAAGGNAVASLNFRQAQGNSVAGQNLPWLGTNSVAASASLSGDVLGTTNYNGYATTGFINDIATQYQGGGVGTTHAVQFQTYAAETFANGTKTLSSADITAVASSFRAALGAPSVTGTKGQISFNATSPGVGQAIRVTGTLTGTATGIVSGQNYWIIATASTTTATLSATPNGPPIDTTAGTLTGLTLTRCGVTFTIANQTSYPFGRNALVTISGVTNLTNGTYPVSGGVTSLTSISLGVPHTTAPTLSGTQSFSCPTVTAAGAGYRIRANPLATPMNPANRLLLVDHTAALMAIRADAVSFNKGSYGGTGGLLPGGDISYRRTYGCFHKMANVTAAAADTVYAFDWTTDTTAHVNTQGVTISNTSRINFDNAGDYNVVIELVGKNTDNSDRTAYVWLAKNGTDIAETGIKLVLTKDTITMIAKDWLVNGIADNDYLEVRFAVDTTVSGISLEYTAAQTTPYVRPAVAAATITITPIGA